MRLDVGHVLQACPAEGVEGSAMMRASLTLRVRQLIRAGEVSVTLQAESVR